MEPALNLVASNRLHSRKNLVNATFQDADFAAEERFDVIFFMHARRGLGIGLQRMLNTLAPRKSRTSAAGDLAASEFELGRRDPGARDHRHGRVGAETDRR